MLTPPPPPGNWSAWGVVCIEQQYSRQPVQTTQPPGKPLLQRCFLPYVELCLFYCYPPSCVVSQQSWFGLFFFINFLRFTPPPPQWRPAAQHLADSHKAQAWTKEATNRFVPRRKYKKKVGVQEDIPWFFYYYYYFIIIVIIAVKPLLKLGS